MTWCTLSCIMYFKYHEIYLNFAKFAFAQIWCITCPNSWKNVSTSSCVNNDGLLLVALVKLQTIAQTGSCLLPLIIWQPLFLKFKKHNFKRNGRKNALNFDQQLLEKLLHVHIFLLLDAYRYKSTQLHLLFLYL